MRSMNDRKTDPGNWSRRSLRESFGSSECAQNAPDLVLRFGEDDSEDVNGDSSGRLRVERARRKKVAR